MKKAINQWCFPSDWSWEAIFDLCQELGFQGVELCIDYTPFFSALHGSPAEPLINDIARSVGSTTSNAKSLRFDSPAHQIARVGALAAEHGVAITSVLTLAQFHFSLVESDPKVRATGIGLVRRLLEIAEHLGAPNVLVVPGLVTSEIEYDDALSRLEDALHMLAPEAAARGVALAIEDVWGKFLYSPIEMRDLIDRVGSPHVGAHFDVGNVMQYGHPDQWIRILGGKRIRNVHLKDFDSNIGNIRGFTHLFQGDVPWDRVMTALRAVGYDGYLIAEVPPYRFAPQQGIRDISRRMDILLEST